MNQTSTSSDAQAQFKEEAAKRALQFVQSGMKVGLGTGSGPKEQCDCRQRECEQASLVQGE